MESEISNVSGPGYFIVHHKISRDNMAVYLACPKTALYGNTYKNGSKRKKGAGF